MARQRKAPARGRQQGRKNLTTNAAGNIVNQHGVEFTADEKRALVNAVNRANAKRTRMLKEQATLPRMVRGKPSGDTVGSLQLMGKESDFIIAKKTKSLQRFTSREQYDKYMDALARVNSPDYVEERIRLYKRNHMTALRNAYGDDAKDVIMKIRMMKPGEYMKMVSQNEDLEIGYVYDPADRNAKLNHMRASMGMKLKDDYYDELDDYE